MRLVLPFIFLLSSAPAFAAWHYDTLNKTPSKQLEINLPYQAIHKNITQALNKCSKGFDVVNGVIYSDLGESEIVFHNKGQLAVAQAVYRITKLQETITKVEAWVTPTVFGNGPIHFSEPLEQLSIQGGQLDCKAAGF